MTIEFHPTGIAIEGREDESLLELARRANLPMGSSCGGEGVCTSCRVRVLDGGRNLSPPDELEIRMASRARFEDDERLGCRARLRGDCRVTTTYW